MAWPFFVSCSQGDAVADGARELASLSVAEVTRLLHNARFSALAARFTQDEIDGEALLDGVDRECVCVFIPLVYPKGLHSPSLGKLFCSMTSSVQQLTLSLSLVIFVNSNQFYQLKKKGI